MFAGSILYGTLLLFLGTPEGRPEAAEDLERALKEVGIAADITYLPELQSCAAGRYTPVDRRTSGLTVEIANRRVGVTIPPGSVREGETFVLTWSVVPMTQAELDGRDAVEGGHSNVEFGVAAGEVHECETVPFPVSPVVP